MYSNKNEKIWNKTRINLGLISIQKMKEQGLELKKE